MSYGETSGRGALHKCGRAKRASDGELSREREWPSEKTNRRRGRKAAGWDEYVGIVEERGRVV